ncbi:MAG TPA: hypothetical protein ENJ82_08075, partial [Bacteroidetes bacterium]|nr:hypothetical protein [Bacteroidota bacterium]
MKRILKSTAVMLLLFFAFAATYAQCSSGNRLEVSNSYTLASGNTGVAIFFRNSTYSWNPASLTKLSFDVTLNGCSPYINRAILTSFNGKATATITSNSTAHFSFSNSSNPFQLVDNEVTMILELAQCSGFGSVDVVISNIAMEISNTPISTAACNGEAVIQSCASSCNTSSRHMTVFGPYTGFTGNPFVAIIYNTPNTFDNVRGLYVKLYASGDLNILNVYSSVLGSGANTSNNGKTASLFYWGATQQLVTWDPVMILELSGNSTCGHINFCS